MRRLNEAGVFGRFIPDFGRVVAQMQYDMYHVYTVDEHTILAIGILHGIETGALKEDHPISVEVVHKVQSRRALYLAVLLHDIAKGRGGDHSEARRRGRAEARAAPRPQPTRRPRPSPGWCCIICAMSNTAHAATSTIPRPSPISSAWCSRSSGCACCWC